MGLTQQLTTDQPLVEGLYVACTAVFMFELGLRICFDRKRFFHREKLWSCFDVATVIASFAEIVYKVVTSHKIEDLFLFLTTMRFLRIVRVAKRIQPLLFRELRLMLHCLCRCLKPLAGALAVLFVVYIFGFYLTQGVQLAKVDSFPSESDFF